MEKKFKLIVVLLIAGVVIFFQSAPTYARYYFLDQALAVDGYLQNQSSFRLGGVGLVACENRFVLEANYAPFPNLSFYGSWRSIYDAVWDIRESHGKYWDRYSHTEDYLEEESEMREFYAQIAIGSWDFRLGKQQIVWGVSDGVRLMDIINPLDMRRQFNCRDWADIRRPMVALKAIYNIDPVRNCFLELVWIPDFQEQNLDLGDPVLAPQSNGPWSIPLPPTTFTPWGAPVVPNIKVKTKSRYSINSSQYGGRLGIELKGWFLTFNYFHRFNDVPSAEFRGTTPLWMTPTGFSPIPQLRLPDMMLLNLVQRYYHMHIVGFTFDKGLWGQVLRGEFALYPDEPVGVRVGDIADHPDLVTRVCRLHSMIGFDAKYWVRWLNPAQMISFSGQFFHFYNFDHEASLVQGPYNQKLNESEFFLSLKINTDYNNARISPDILMVYDVTNTGWYIKPRVEFKYGDHWRPEIGAIIFEKGGFELPFGIMDNKDEIYFRLKYLF